MRTKNINRKHPKVSLSNLLTIKEIIKLYISVNSIQDLVTPYKIRKELLLLIYIHISLKLKIFLKTGLYSKTKEKCCIFVILSTRKKIFCYIYPSKSISQGFLVERKVKTKVSNLNLKINTLQRVCEVVINLNELLVRNIMSSISHVQKSFYSPDAIHGNLAYKKLENYLGRVLSILLKTQKLLLN